MNLIKRLLKWIRGTFTCKRCGKKFLNIGSFGSKGIDYCPKCYYLVELEKGYKYV